ncbi:hypothetical protein CEK25_004142 [Fusarium fujikuroi]|nr:hypothetical protein CEK25_004142 [Fusarium fujikuroi]
MSGFQITDAVPNNPKESLQHLPTEVQASEAASPHQSQISDAVVDNPKDPPSLTGALEAKPSAAKPAPAAQPAPTEVEQPESRATLRGADQGDNPGGKSTQAPYESSSEIKQTLIHPNEDSDDNEGYVDFWAYEETAESSASHASEGGSDDEGD